MEKNENTEKRIIIANTVANCWIEKKLPSSKEATVDEKLQVFRRAAVEKILKETPNMINNGNLFFKGLPYVPVFPWIYWTYIDWENFRIITRQGITSPLNST